MEDRLVGASPAEQDLFDSLRAHERDEQDVISAYETFAEISPSEVVRYLIGLILEDERRHHRILKELVNKIRADATLEKRDPRLPYLDVHRGDLALLEATRRFLAIERRDRAQLKRIAPAIRRLGGHLDAFVIDMLRSDTDRHIATLCFIEQLVRRSPLG